MTVSSSTVIDNTYEGATVTSKLALEPGCYEIGVKYQNDAGAACLDVAGSTDLSRTFAPFSAGSLEH